MEGKLGEELLRFSGEVMQCLRGGALSTTVVGSVASVTARQQDRPSLTTLLPAARSRLASRRDLLLAEALHHRRQGRRSGPSGTGQRRLAGRAQPQPLGPPLGPSRVS